MKDTKDTPKNSMDALLEEQISLNNTLTRLDIERCKVQIISDRVEQARRNVEVISRFINGFTEGQDIHAKMKPVLLENLEILKEVKNIK